MLKNMNYHGDKALEVYQTLHEMKHCNLNFFLTGSRYFGHARPDSDWDFFVQDTSAAHDWLIQNQFRSLNPDTEADLRLIYPDDNHIVSVYEKGKVQIQLVNDTALKQHAQAILSRGKVFGYFRNSGPGEARSWWRWAYQLAEGIARGDFE